MSAPTPAQEVAQRRAAFWAIAWNRYQSAHFELEQAMKCVDVNSAIRNTPELAALVGQMNRVCAQVHTHLASERAAAAAAGVSFFAPTYGGTAQGGCR